MSTLVTYALYLRNLCNRATSFTWKEKLILFKFADQFDSYSAFLNCTEFWKYLNFTRIYLELEGETVR